MAISLYELAQRVNSAMPLGTIVPYYGTDEPSGWKICDGRSCAGTDLAKKLGISVVPDLRGRFIRMIGGNAAGMAVAQEDCIRNITGSSSLTGGGYSGLWIATSGVFGGYGSVTSYIGQGGGDYTQRGFNFDASRVVPTGPENRPINMAFNYIIKVVGTNVILYYVSNIIYKAKAHICRTFSFVKSFQREVRNSMSISLNDHEDRINKLEAFAGSRAFVWLGGRSQILHNGKLQMPNGRRYTEYAFLLFEISTNEGFIHTITNGVAFNQIDTSIHGGNPYRYVVGSLETSKIVVTPSLDGLTLEINEGTNTRFSNLYGLKLYYNFSYNIYRLTQILFNSSLLGLFSQKGGARTI